MYRVFFCKERVDNNDDVVDDNDVENGKMGRAYNGSKKLSAPPGRVYRPCFSEAIPYFPKSTR